MIESMDDIESPTELDLMKFEYAFALYAIDPRIGRFEAYQVVWNADSPRKTRIDIQMVECFELLDSDDRTEGYIGNPVFNPYVTYSARRK